MALNGTGIEFGKSEHDSRRITSRATTTSADFIVLRQRCGVQVVLQKVGRDKRTPPVPTFSVCKTRFGARRDGPWSGVVSVQTAHCEARLSGERPSLSRVCLDDLRAGARRGFLRKACRDGS
jgi:hypothetical protein